MSKAKLVIRVITLAALGVHFALTLAYVLPPNPTKAALQPLLDRTIDTYFAQNWSLFAPEPISANLDLVVRCLSRDEAEAADRGELPKTGWRDLSAPLWEQFQQHRFSAYDRLARPNTAYVREFMFGDDQTRGLIEDCQKGGQESCRVYDELIKRHREIASRQLARIGSLYCREANPQPTAKVAIEIRKRDAVPWSRRGGAAVTNDLVVGVFPLDESIPVEPIFARED